MKNLLYGFALVLTVVLLSSCEDSQTFKGNRRLGLASSGKIEEILIVTEGIEKEGPTVQFLDSALMQFILPYFPDVPTFTCIHKTKDEFLKGVKIFPQILWLEVNPNFTGTKPKIEKRNDAWALDQLVVHVEAKTQEELDQVIRMGVKNIHAEFDEHSWKKLMVGLGQSNNYKIDRVLANTFGIKLKIPNSSKIINDRPNFMRIDFPDDSKPIQFTNAGSEEKGAVLSGLMIYQYPFKDSSQFVLERLLVARDTMLKYNAPYEIYGMYMGTQYAKLVYPEGNRAISANAKISGYDVRGMYTFVGRSIHTTGGAFWNFHFVHPKTKQLICISGFLDAPPTARWTHWLREIQAVLRSVEIVE